MANIGDNACPIFQNNLGISQLTLDADNTTDPDTNGEIRYVSGTGFRMQSEGTVYTIPTSATAGAATSLNNLASVAINTSLISDTDDTDDLGSSTKQWKDLYIDGIAYCDQVNSNTIDERTAAAGVTIDGVQCKDNGLIFAGDVVVNTNKFTVAGVSGNTLVAGTLGVTGAAILSSNLAVTGASALTGNVSCGGDLSVSGSLSFGGAWTVADTLTVDELIFDTDGSAPAATNCYGVRDNAGDLTLNCVTAKTINLAVAGTDEYVFSASTLDMGANALDNCGFLILNAATAPAGTEVYAVNDNTGDLTLNALTGKEVCIAVAGTDIIQVGTELELIGGTNLQFLGNDDIVDSGANELVTFSATTAAVNGLQIKNAATGTRPAIGSNGAGAEADIGLNVLDSNGNELVEFVATAAATNGLLITNSATANPVIIGANGTGATANRGIRFNDSNGNEALVLASTASAVNEIGIVNTATTVKPIIRAQGEGDLGMVLANYDGANTEEILILAATATAVNEITITSTATGTSPSIAATGDDANINLSLTPKGTGVVLASNISGGVGAGGDFVLSSTTNATKGCLTIANGEQGLKIGNTTDRATTEGTNQLVVFNGTAPAGTLANGISVYSTGGECYIMDAAGNSTLQSPHTPDGDFIIKSYSQKKGETVTIHLEKILLAIAESNPELAKFVEVFKGGIHEC